MTYVKFTVQMVCLMQKCPRQEFLAGLFVVLPRYVLRPNRYLLGPRYRFTEIGDAQASLVLSMTSFRVDDFWVGEDQLRLRILFKSDINDGKALGDPDLGCG